MSSAGRYCQQCGTKLQFRLGEFECDSCTARRINERDAGPAAGAAIDSATQAPDLPAPELRSTQDIRLRNASAERFDPSPGLEREKLILIAVYVGRVLVTSMIALINGKDLDDAGVPTDAIAAALMSAVLLVPIPALKTVVAYLALIYGGLGLLAILRYLFLFVSLGVMLAGYGWLGSLVYRDVMDSYFFSLLISLFAACLDLWLASVLFRDVHRLQTLRG